ncbi:kinesin-like protein KIFC2 isoform X2 [Cricetulus griseus]|uniref:kinesin-like protein KIFC2 isoform X2 n=1 Tax=Cricetulus griseus TaxID=10029 RepID=UPI0015C3CC17|nr:kinesin-like protein KIFC2 isoform X2 [Cricetulus griseus]
MRLAEFLSLQLGAEESCGTPSDPGKPGEVPPLLTVTSQLLALLAWTRSPRGRQVLLQGTQPACPVQPSNLDGSLSQEESSSQPTPILDEVPGDETQEHQPPQLEEEQRAWQRLEQLILGQLEELRQQLEQQEEELSRLRLGVGVTDSEKRVQHLTLENEVLKQSLSLAQDLLLRWGPGPLARAQQVSWALGALSAGGARTQLSEGQQGPPTGCAGRLLELKGNIRVLCRVRPAEGIPSSLVSMEPGQGGTITTCYRGRQHRFRLDWVFPPDASQEEVFRQLEPAVLSCLQGYSVCIFTYGQTGTGKTYSMEGPPEDPGIAPRALQLLFREMGTGGHHHVTLSMVEIYNEAVRDLLATGPPERLVVRQGPAGQGGIQVTGLTHWDVPNLETLHQMLSLGRSNRATAATVMNQHSSRSHALVTLTLRAASPSCAQGITGTLHLVDLAGSERVWKAGVASTLQRDPNGARRLREAQSINRSLLALGGVMAALRARRPHVPFRDSQLTRLLQPALGAGTTAVLLLQISTRTEDLGETICSLKFAQRVGQVELGPARRRRAPRSGTPSSLSTDTPLTGTSCTPTPSPGSPPSPGPNSCSGLTLEPPGDLPP